MTNAIHPASSSQLGNTTAYPQHYDASLLFAIDRSATRQPDSAVHWVGVDVWHAYEVSWLALSGKPYIAILRFGFDANSPYLVESKSFKLYLNSLNLHKVGELSDLIDLLKADLSQLTQSAVTVEVLPTNSHSADVIDGIALDAFAIPRALQSELLQPNRQLLTYRDDLQQLTTPAQEYTVYSHLLRSLCPVTSQPDWATIIIRFKGAQVDLTALLAYIVSFREHSGFHEQCVEQIYTDFMLALQPEQLMVYAAYTRRGGLDINPCRASSQQWIMPAVRLARQ